MTATVLLAASLFLSGCDNAEERAEEHFQTGLELVEAGDTTRAAVEMRNVLQLVPSHAEARSILAGMLLEEGNLKRAVFQYRTLLEHHPETGEANLVLAEILLDAGDWDNAKKYGLEAERLLGDEPRVAAISASLAYRDAIENDDREAREAATVKARALIETNPELQNARRVLIDWHLRMEEWTDALAMTDAALEVEPDRMDLARIRLSTLRELGRTDELTAQLKEMVVRHPEDESLPLMTVRWLVELDDLDSAEAFLRDRANESPEDEERQVQLVQFINETRGAERAIAELTRLSEASDASRFRAMRANLMFENGQQDEAMADLKALSADLAEDPDSVSVLNDIRVDLARMNVLTGNQEVAKTLVAETLEQNPTHAAALKMQSTWLIDEDDVDQAIANLRSALRDNPRDPQIMTLMAVAHERAGEPQLQREMLSLAVEASNSAPEESLRYARFLIADGRFRPAEDVVIDALRRSPNNVALLNELGRVYMAIPDFPRAEQVRDTLKKISETTDDPATLAAVNTLQTQLLATQNKESELFEFLDDLAAGEAGLAADIAILRAHVARGDMEIARERLEALKAKNPDLPLLKFLSAAVSASEGKIEQASAELEAILVDTPKAERVWMALYRLQLLTGDPEKATEVLDRALVAMPDGGELLFSRAGQLERAGSYEEAIGIYETLYARNSSNEIVANNLASMLSSFRADPETLDRAYRIGRRLQDSQVPAFRDTYGWIAARLGRLEEAEEHLKFAVEGIPGHPLIQYHYAVTLAGLERNAEALEHFQKAEELAGTVLPAADLEVVQAEIERLTAAVAAEPEAPPAQE